LLRELSDAGHITTDDTFERMKGGRTNKVWKFGKLGEAKVLKLYRTSDANPLFENNQSSEIICLTALAASGLAPQLMHQGSHPTGRWIIYKHVSGLAWNQSPAPVARLLADIHSQAPIIGLKTGTSGSAKIRDQTLKILDRCQSASRCHIAAQMPRDHVPPLGSPCLIHGDPVPGNIVSTSQNPVLIDWQCPANGDPTEDLALFLSPTMQTLYRGTPLSISEHRAFLAAYPNRNIVARYHLVKPWYHWRMAAYCLWQIGQGNTDYANGLDLECDQLNTLNTAL
jgi:thiamine kinase-like enzyme